MQVFSHRLESVLSGKSTKYVLSASTEPLTYDAALQLMTTNSRFAQYLTELLRSSVYTAFRWETPPVTSSTIGRPFEFVLTSDPYLEMEPEPEVFGPYFAKASPGTPVLAVWNLGKTARMVVPRQLGEPSTYTHLANFVRRAAPAQIYALWACVAATVRESISVHPLWVSTAGGGVSWLHVRIEGSPKYYSYRPYANDA